MVDRNFRVLSSCLIFRAGAHSFLFVPHSWGLGDHNKDGEGTMSCVVLHKDLGILALSSLRDIKELISQSERMAYGEGLNLFSMAL